MKKSKIVLITANVVGSLLLLWIVASYFNIVAHNATDCNYWTFNFFTLLFK